MRQTCKVFIFSAIVSFAFLACGQDEQSLGAVARQSRQQKQQQAKDAQAKDAQTKDKDGQPAKAKVITNDEIPSHVGPTVTSHDSGIQPVGVNYSEPSSGGYKASPEQWKSQIQSQKNMISSLQSQIDKLNDSIHFAPANCVSNCVQWNERQREKQQQVDQMKAQLEDQQKRLEDMQEAARQQGYGSAVYDP
jgi:hypothetical protein